MRLDRPPHTLPKLVVALYYPGKDEYVGVMAKQREAIPGLLVFESIVHLTLYQCAGSEHSAAMPKVLRLKEAREVVRTRNGFESIILFRPPSSFTVEYVI